MWAIGIIQVVASEGYVFGLPAARSREGRFCLAVDLGDRRVAERRVARRRDPAIAAGTHRRAGSSCGSPSGMTGGTTSTCWTRQGTAITVRAGDSA